MVDVHTVVHTAVLAVLLWQVIRHRRDMRDLGKVLQTVIEAQAVFRPTIEEIHSRLEDVWESQATRQSVIESHKRQEAALEKILERLG